MAKEINDQSTGTREICLDERVYETLRIFHSEIKDLLDEEMTNEQKNAIEALHSVLYLAEEHFTNF